MLLLLTILINATIGVIFKLFQRFEINNLQAIIVNYFTCAVTAALVEMRWVVTPDVISKPWFPIAVVLSLLFISIFNVVALAVQKLGILVTTLFQKMSLVWPTILGIVIYTESVGVFKLLGLAFAFCSIFLINYAPGMSLSKKQIFSIGTVLAAATFIGSGIIEMLLYYTKAEGLTVGDDLEFTATLFFLAGVIGLIFFLVTAVRRPVRFKWKNMWGGILLGVPNFFSIYFIMVMLDRGWEGSALFPLLNVGILVVNALIGIFAFKENMNVIRAAGFGAALLAILLLVSQ